MDIASIQAFLAVARERSFSRASERLFITQPAVSKRVASLESELGVTLFNRVARTVSLTEAGQQLLAKAQEVVDHSEELQRYASNLNDEITGDLSIAISHHAGLHRMPPVLRQFNQQYPQVKLDIRFEDSEQAFHSVEIGDIEFGVLTLPTELPKWIKAEVVWPDDLQIVVADDHPLATVTNPSLADISTYPAVLPNKDTETHQIIQREFDREKLQLQVQMETNNLETLKMLVGVGLGWSLLPTNMLQQQDINNQRSLKQVAIQRSLQRNLGIVLHSKRSLSNAASALRHMILESGR